MPRLTEAEGGKIKPANFKTQTTPDQMKEIAKCATDPVYFIKNYVKLQHPVQGSLPFNLFDYQEKMVRFYDETHYSVALLPRQCGKSLHVECKIPTPSGWTTMGELEVGDELFSEDGTITKVVAAHPIRTDRPCYRFTFDNGQEIIADAEHLWKISTTVYQNDREVILTTSEIIPLLEKAHDQDSSVKIRKAKLEGHNGFHHIVSITNVESVPVRCIEVDHPSHMFLCSESMIPTHNTQTAAGYLLWWAIFKPDQEILILSKDHPGAKDILSRFWYSYEELPWWMKPGVVVNDVQTKKFDNNTKIKALATTENSGRGMSISLLYCIAPSSHITLRHKITGEIVTMKLEDVAKYVR